MQFYIFLYNLRNPALTMALGSTWPLSL